MASHTKKILIAGAGGHLGSRLAQYLSHRHDVHLRLTIRSSSGAHLMKYGDVIQGDLQKREFCESVTAGCDYVVNLVGVPAESPGRPNPVEAFAAVTRNLVETSRQHGVRRFVHLSSIHVFGSSLHGRVSELTDTAPLTTYASAHWRAEKAISVFESSGIHPLILRCGNGFGYSPSKKTTSGSQLAWDLCRQAVTENVLRLRSHGLHQRDFITNRDIVRAVEHFVFNDAATGVILLGSGRSMSVLEFTHLVIERVQQRFHRRPKIIVNSKDSSHPLRYELDITRLRNRGFNLHNFFQTEIDELLSMTSDTLQL